MSWKDTIKPIEAPKQELESDTSSEPSILDDVSEKAEALGAGLVKGGSLGFADEIGGAIGAGGAKLTGSEESLSDLYKKYKELTQQKLDESAEKSVLGKVGEIGGNIATGAALLPVTAGIGATVAAGAGLGALQGLGESENSLLEEPEQVARDVLLSGATGGAAGGIGQGIAKGIGYLGKQALDSQFAGQLAATVKNKAAGGTVLGKTAGDVIRSKSDKLGEEVAQSLVSPVTQRSKDFTTAFEAAEEAGQKLIPDSGDLKTLSDAASVLKAKGIKAPVEAADDVLIEKIAESPSAISNVAEESFDFSTQLKKLMGGRMTPEEANAFRGRLKEYISDLKSEKLRPDLYDKAERLENSGLIEKIEEMSSKAGTDIGGLNKNLYEARKMVEDALGIKQSGRLDSSDLLEKAQTRVDKLLGKQGQTTLQGDIGRKEVKDLYDILKGFSQKGETSINPDKIIDDISEQSLLNAARRNITGVTEASTESTPSFLKSIRDKVVSSPYALAELTAKNKSVQGVANTILKADKMQLKAMSDKFVQTPELKALGDELARALESGSKQRLNAVLFSLSQNPAARSIANSLTPESMLPGEDR